MIIDTSITNMERNIEFRKEEEKTEQCQREAWDLFASSFHWGFDENNENETLANDLVNGTINYTSGTYGGNFIGGGNFLNNTVLSSVGSGIIVDDNTFTAPLGGAISFNI